MRGKLFDAARRDMAKFATSGGFEQDMSITTKDGSLTVDVKGLSSGKMVPALNALDNQVISSTFHVSIPEQTLLDLEYPVRNALGKVAMIDHRVTVNDNTDTPRNFIVTENHPNTTTGLIVLILGRAE